MKSDEMDKMTNKQFNQFLETIIIILENTQDISKAIEYIKRIQTTSE